MHILKRHSSDKQTQPWTKLSLGSELISWNDICDNWMIDKPDRSLSVGEFNQVQRNQLRVRYDAASAISSTLWHVSRNHGRKSRNVSGDNVQVQCSRLRSDREKQLVFQIQLVTWTLFCFPLHDVLIAWAVSSFPSYFWTPSPPAPGSRKALSFPLMDLPHRHNWAGTHAC